MCRGIASVSPPPQRSETLSTTEINEVTRDNDGANHDNGVGEDDFGEDNVGEDDDMAHLGGETPCFSDDEEDALVHGDDTNRMEHVDAVGRAGLLCKLCGDTLLVGEFKVRFKGTGDECRLCTRCDLPQNWRMRWSIRSNRPYFFKCDVGSFSGQRSVPQWEHPNKRNLPMTTHSSVTEDE